MTSCRPDTFGYRDDPGSGYKILSICWGFLRNGNGIRIHHILPFAR
jgi:hypothetical protein